MMNQREDPNSIEPGIPPESDEMCDFLEGLGMDQEVIDQACEIVEKTAEKYLQQAPDETTGKYIILGDHDPTKWTVNKETGAVTFSFPGHKIEMSWLTAHQLRAQIGSLDPLQNAD